LIILFQKKLKKFKTLKQAEKYIKKNYGHLKQFEPEIKKVS